MLWRSYFQDGTQVLRNELGITDSEQRGAAPIYAGQPGYSAALDGNSDGVACS